MKKVLAATLLALTLAAPAAAHVTVQPTQARTGAFTTFVVRVPNERDNAATVKIEVQLPDSLQSVGFQPAPGWKRTVSGTTVMWEGGRVEPHEFVEFGFSARTPDAPTELRFPAVQTYDNGEVVRWIGPADGDEPAGRVRTFDLGSAGDLELLAAATAEDEGTEPAEIAGWAALALSVVALALAVVRRRPAPA